jgi:hypothetical protein
MSKVSMKVFALLTCVTASIAFAGVADGGTASPVFGASVEVVPVFGTVSFATPGNRSVQLTQAQQLPVGSTVDATNGQVRIIAVDPAGGTHSGVFFEGVFSIQQPVAERGVVEITLAAPLPVCGLRAAAARATRGRHLGSKADPYFSSSGYSARTTPAPHLARDAAVISPTWEVADGCTLFQRTTVVQAMQGTVAVTSPVTHKPVVNHPTVTASSKPLCYFGHVRVHGKFSTSGRFAAATVRGATDAHAANGSFVMCPNRFRTFGAGSSATVRG